MAWIFNRSAKGMRGMIHHAGTQNEQMEVGNAELKE
jgi:hypothetical protein